VINSNLGFSYSAFPTEGRTTTMKTARPLLKLKTI